MVRTGILLAVLLAAACQDHSAVGQFFDNNLNFECPSAVAFGDSGSESGQYPHACEASELDQACGGQTNVPDDDSAWSLFGASPFLGRRGIDINFQLDLGITTNSRNPTNPAGGPGNQPATQFNYLNDQFMMNQLLITLERQPKSEHGEFGFGWHVDMVYGTDYFCLQSRGLETNNDFSNRWNSDMGSGIDGNSRMGLALPQLYFQTVLGDWTATIGHFYSPLGNESPIPVADQFYSNTYGSGFSFESTQVTGMMFERTINARLKCIAGFHRGMQNWEDNNTDLNTFGGFVWNSRDDSTSIEFVFDVGKENDAGTATRYLQSIVLEKTINEPWCYVITSDFGAQQELAAGAQTAYWYNVVQYATYQFDDQWYGGLRFEWFDDINGAVVSPTAGPGTFYALSLGLNYQPNANILVRPEIRWDSFDADAGVPPGPFGDGTNRNQFMAAVDCVLSF